MSEHHGERRFPRFDAEHTALLKTIDEGAEGFARTRVVSIGGCGIVLPEPIPSGVAVELLLAIESQVFQLFGRTIYSRRIGPDRVEVGLEFLDVVEEDADLLESVLRGAA